MEAKAYSTLVDSLEAELPEHVKKDCLTIHQRCELARRIKAALPADLQKAFWAHEEAKDIDASLQREAAYLVGLEMGRWAAGCGDGDAGGAKHPYLA